MRNPLFSDFEPGQMLQPRPLVRTVLTVPFQSNENGGNNGEKTQGRQKNLFTAIS
jgi:hypothetical protein